MDFSLLRKNNFMNYEKERKIREITKEVLNSKCIDCHNGKPEFISLNNAVFICRNCYRNIHQKFPVKISRIIKNNLKSLSLKDLQYLYFGGNKKMLEFMKYEYPKLIKINSFSVYKTVAMEYYRNWLSYLVEGGNKPMKPDIEIAYYSIEDKLHNNNYLSNNDSDVITIDFINDCYNYNDKYNNSITNFINKKKHETNRQNLINNNNINNNNNFKENTRLKFKTDKDYYQKSEPSNNLKEFLNYYKAINKNNYEKYVSNQSNKNINTNSNINININNDNFSKTQNNFNKNITNNEDIYYITNRRKKMSQDNIIEEIDNNFDLSNNEKNNYNNKIIKGFKTNNRIYIKPKHTFIKSFEREPTNVDIVSRPLNELKINEVYISTNNNNNVNNNNNDISPKMAIKVKRESKNKIEEKIIKKNNNINNNNSQNENENIPKKFNKNKIKVGGVRSKYAKKKINNNFPKKNKINGDKDNKDKDKEKNKIINDKENDKNYNTQEPDNTEIDNTKSNINEVSISNFSSLNLNNLNNINNDIVKKKNLNNNDNGDNFYSNFDKKHYKNYSTVEHSQQFEIISKNGVDTTRDDKSYEESYDDTQNTIQTLPLNKSMRHFYSRYPRKMKRTKTNRRKLNDENKKKEKKEKNKYLKLKREKSEIIQSLKVLLKKKEQMKNENNNNINNNDNNEEFSNYKTTDNELKKKIFVNKIKNEELNKIIINENKRRRKGSSNNNENNNKNIEFFDEKYQDKKIYVKQNEELIGDKNSIRSKYKNKKTKNSDN